MEKLTIELSQRALNASLKTAVFKEKGFDDAPLLFFDTSPHVLWIGIDYHSKGWHSMKSQSHPVYYKDGYASTENSTFMNVLERAEKEIAEFEEAHKDELI